LALTHWTDQKPKEKKAKRRHKATEQEVHVEKSAIEDSVDQIVR
jgi:hypothetical protein